MTRRVGPLVAAVAALVARPAAWQQSPFRAGIDLVSVYATVTDRAGRLILDLGKDDFVVTDNGKPQPIAVFNNGVQPITIVVMLDRSGSMADNADLVVDAVSEFVKKLLPADKARIGDLSREIHIAPDGFTSDHDELLRILRQDLQPVGPSPIWTAVDRSITALLHEGGRRVVLLFSDGHDAPIAGQVRTDVKDVMYRAQYDEIMIYSIGFPTTEIVRPRFGGSRTPLGPRGPIQIGPPFPATKVTPPDSNMRKLAGETGGGYVELSPEQSLVRAFTRVADELHHQYWMGFVPAKLDGKIHRIEVKVKRPDFGVRARRSYVADPYR